MEAVGERRSPNADLVRRALSPHSIGCGVGRVVEVEGASYFDPYPPGPPHPRFGGAPEPRSSCSVPCSSPDDLPIDRVFVGQGWWTGETWTIERWCLLPQHVLPDRRPADPATPSLSAHESAEFLASIPPDLEQGICEVGVQHDPLNRSRERVVIGVSVLTPQWRAWAEGPGSAATVHATLWGADHRGGWTAR